MLLLMRKLNFLFCFLLQSGRELDDFIRYIAKHATKELKGYDRKGNAKKTEL